MSVRNMLMAQVAGLESLDAGEAAQVKDIAEAAAEKTAEEVAELIIEKEAGDIAAEVKELADEVEDLSEEVEELDEEVEELEECVEGMESLLKAGSFNGAAFGILYKRAEKLNAKLGGKDTGAVVGAESLGDGTSAALAARAGMEGFVETLKGYGDAAVKFVVSMYNAAIEYVKGLFDKSVSIAKQVTALKERISKTEELKKDVKPGKWASLARITDVAKIEAIVSAADKVVEAGRKLADNDVNGYKSAYGQLKAAIEGLKTAGEAKEAKSGDKVTHQIKVGAVTFNATVYTGEIASHDDVKKACKATALSFSAEKTADVKFEALTKSTIGTMLGGAETLGKALAKLKESKSANATGRDELVAAIKKAETKKEEWVKPAIGAIKASTAMTNKIFTVASRAQAAIADAKLAAVKAYL